MIVRRACPRLCAALSLLALVAASCGGREGPQSGFDLTKCVETGLCECTDNDQCPGDRICVNGWCQAGPGGGSDGGVADAGRVPDLEADVPVEPGALGWPCADDGECDSGVCLEITESLRLCTQTCIAECPPGWDCRGISQGDTLVFYCLPRTDRLCQPCLSDASCTGPGSLCVDLGGIPSCGRDCAGGDCPTGYVCEDVVSVDGVAAPQCIPESGVCQCTPENIGESFPCGITNDAGTCFGAQVCLEDGTLTPCSAKTPAAEVCDGKDNNCDGFADEDAAGDTCLSENEHGTCEGTVQCLPGGVEACSAAEPAAETCDTLDNDCDGETDEDFRSPDGLYTDFEHCGACGQSCEGLFAHAVETACLVAEGVASCGILSCEPGFALSQDQSICLPAIHHLCEPCVEDASCVGPGDRCLQLSPTDQQTFCGRDCAEGNAYGEGCPDGYVCAPVVALDGEAAEQCIPVNGTCDCTEAAEGLVKPCTQVTPDGICYGIAVCDPVQGWTGCTAKIPAPEFCDGLDNDCDGIIDQGLTFVPCTVSSDWGTCTGQTLCLGIDGETCTAALPAEDVCNGLDDDCDGVPDDDFASVVPQTDPPMLVYHKSLLHCGGCGVPCAAVPPATATACIADGAQALCVVTACGEGYVLSDGGVCLPLPTANLCLPCAADAQCLGPTDQCVDYPDGSFCGRDCSAGSPYSLGAGGDPGFCTGEEGVQGCCPPGFLCAAGQCVRESQSCACDQDGKVRPCEVGNAEGTCTGLQECIATGPAAGWQPCSALTPAPEICDGVDNDCDGLFDALDPGIDVTGLDGYPSCQNVSAACTGSWTCGGAGGGFQWFCSAKEPEPETCNGLDDDCDAMVDEDFLDAGGEFGTLAHCGRCNLDCTQALAHLATDAGGAVLPDAVACEDHGDGFACVPLLCEAGYYPFPQDDPLVCLALSAANCQPCVKPGDCAGPDHGCFTVGIDDGAWCAQRCDAGALFTGCTGEIGAQGCCPAGFTCEAVPGAVPGELHCRPLADTCQCSAANEGLVKPCTATGDGGQVTCWGITTCGPEGELFTWGPCDTSGSVEVCDGLDNDCDG
ncbi:MAG: hypothetical protein FJ098_02735, partial [Deltaproteobacteria bacterium]|nr:hypothetical protein [Deltaproteobacteria bacterium]